MWSLRRYMNQWRLRVTEEGEVSVADGSTLEEKRPGCCSGRLIVGMTQAHLPPFVEKST